MPVPLLHPATLLPPAVLLLSVWVAGCAPIRTTTGDAFWEFEDPDTDFASAEVFDSSGDSVGFLADSDVLVFGEVEAEGWPVVDGLWLRDDRFFQVRFGSEDGEPRAYITETEAQTVCDVRLVTGEVKVFATQQPVPQD